MRGRRNGAPAPIGQNGSGAKRPDELELDKAYDELTQAQRLWRREPDDERRKVALIKAIDRRDDAVQVSVAEDLRLAALDDDEESEDVSSV